MLEGRSALGLASDGADGATAGRARQALQGARLQVGRHGEARQGRVSEACERSRPNVLRMSQVERLGAVVGLADHVSDVLLLGRPFRTTSEKAVTGELRGRNPAQSSERMIRRGYEDELVVIDDDRHQLRVGL